MGVIKKDAMALEILDIFRRKKKKKNENVLSATQVFSHSTPSPWREVAAISSILRWGTELGRLGNSPECTAKGGGHRGEPGPPEDTIPVSSSRKRSLKHKAHTPRYPRWMALKLSRVFMLLSISIHQPCHRKCWRIQLIHLLYIKIHFMAIPVSGASRCTRKLRAPAAAAVTVPRPCLLGAGF